MRTTIVFLVVLLMGTIQVQGQIRPSTRDQVLQSLVTEDKTVAECVEKSGGLGRTFKIQEVNLSKGDSREIRVRGIAPCVCGPRKCLNRIYRHEGDRLELLLKADFAQEIEPQELFTNGHRNLWAAVYMYHSFTSVLYEYQYDGTQYKWDHCLMRFYYHAEKVKGVHFAGRVRYHSKPSISWVGCNPYDPFGP